LQARLSGGRVVSGGMFGLAVQWLAFGFICQVLRKNPNKRGGIVISLSQKLQ
jgi:hypothetical protein